MHESRLNRLSRAVAVVACLVPLVAVTAWGQSSRLLVGAVVHAPDGARRAAVLIREDEIAAVVEPAAAQELRGEVDEVVDLSGAHVIPGIIDAHLHITGYGRALEQVDLRGTVGWPEVVARVAERAGDLPAGAWVQGRGWDQNLWADTSLPDRRVLDEAVPDHPVLVRRVDGHAAVANTVALERAGVDADTPDPPGGRIGRFEDGTPNGLLIDAAVGLVGAAIPEAGPATVARWIRRAARAFVAQGLTQVQDAGTTALELRVLRRLEAEGRLPLRVYVMLDGTDEELLARELACGPQLTPRRMLRVGAVKLFADGALGSRGALLGADYADDPGNRGLAVRTPEELWASIDRASKAGFQVAIHAIGDEAVHRVLDLYENVGAERCRELRHRIEHSQTVRPGDVERFARLGVVASIQPTHCTSDMGWAPDRLGPERIAWAYRWRSLLDAGVWLSGGTDAPVEPCDPRRTLHAAVTRRSDDGTPAGGWRTEECLTPEEALSLVTEGAAYAAFAESWSGAVAAGYVADLTVLGCDPLRASTSEAVLDCPVLRTVVGGVDRYTAVGGS